MTAHPYSGIGTIYAYADFYDYVRECQEAGGSVTACSVGGGSAYLSQAINCGCAIPTFSNASVTDSSCPIGLYLNWNAAIFDSGSGHYDIYRSSISFADVASNPPLATNLVTLNYYDNSVTQFINYWYVVRAEDDAVAPGGCSSGPHGGMYTDVNVGPITDNLPASAVDFTGTPGGGSGSYTCTWDFGDDQTGSGCTTSHTYASSGTYTVTFTVMDDNTGCKDVDTQDVTM